jgi:dihydrofolate reductase
MHCFLIAALTIDGRIGRDSGDISTSWTSTEDRHWFYRRTKEAGVIIMGSKTYAITNKALPGRLNVVYSSKAEAQPVPDPEQGKGQVWQTNLAPAELLAELSAAGYNEVAICGGTSIYTQFLAAGVVDTLYISIEPKLFGSGVSFCNEWLDLSLELQKVTQLTPQVIMLEYKIPKRHFA